MTWNTFNDSQVRINSNVTEVCWKDYIIIFLAQNMWVWTIIQSFG